ncbi:hypothetical protein [Leptolyngbya sp. AN02str]|uniref:hypothetical protein n=1 Tax=Leptolyngbya sp. AN02str TaxID=3423363 RepID=UPI003D320E65
MTETKDSTAEQAKTETASKSEGKSEVTALTVKQAQESGLQITGGADRPVAPGAIEVAESFTSAGLRPIAASHLDVYGTILNGRPIMASDIRVLDTTTIPGNRPVFVSNIAVREELTLPGGRPIFASSHQLMDAPLLPGGRPIADNDTDDADLLMGYID